MRLFYATFKIYLYFTLEAASTFLIEIKGRFALFEKVFIVKVTKVDGKCNICGKRLKNIRKAHELSQEQVAVRLQLEGLNISQKAISRIETGKRVITDYELKYLATALNVSIYDLLGIEEQL